MKIVLIAGLGIYNCRLLQLYMPNFVRHNLLYRLSTFETCCKCQSYVLLIRYCTSEIMSKNLQNEKDQIAIIGIGCRFPGGVNSPESFWKLLRDGKDAITEIPSERWDVDALYDVDQATPGKTYVRRGGFIEDVDRFDPEFFGISPREATHIDPQQRLLLEVSYEALEDAGEVPEHLSGKPVGVFVGYYIHDYAHIQLFDRSLINAHTGTGTAMSIGANRISYLFNFRGPSVALDTACSSSLVAVHLACQSLFSGESDLALAGGVNAILRPEMTVAMSKASMLSADGRCKSFDARANGYVRAEGGGIVLLKRLSEALRDGNPIHAIIRSSAVNQDGTTNGISVPNGEAQQKLLWEAYKRAGITPNQIQYVEAHGTGTPVGDPIEANALGSVLATGRPDNRPCLMGSVKTNIGHTESASGVAGLIKVVLSLRNRQIPPNLHFEEPNPKIRFDEYKLRVPTKLESWPETEEPRLASLNSFGFGGTNAHLVIQEAPVVIRTAISATSNNSNQQQNQKTAYTLPLSAHSPEALNAIAQAYRNYLTENSSQTLLKDILYTAAVRRNHREERMALTADNKEDMIELLDAFLAREKRANLASGFCNPKEPVRPVFVFTGMGPQWWAMGRQLLEQEPVYREVVERCDALLREYTDWSLLAELTADEDQSRINETFVTQPAIFALQAGLFALWQSWGVEPAAILGHSVGEIAATYAAGILSLEDAIKVIYHRSRLQHRTAGQGRMLAVGLSETEARDLLLDYENLVAIAAINSPNSVTLAGNGATLESIQKEQKARGVFARFLEVSVPYHSPAMEPLKEELYESLQDLKLRPAKVPFYSTILAKQMEGSELTADYWWKNVRNSVLFQATIEQLAEVGHHTFLEIGPHPALSRSIIECLHTKKGTVIPSLRRKNKDESVLDERALLLNSLGKLYVCGYAVDWTKQYPEGQVVRLPSYPWQRERYWSETKESEQRRRGLQHYSVQAQSGRIHPLLGYRLGLVQPVWDAQIKSMEYMKDHRVRGAVIYPGAAYLEMALIAAASVFEEEACILDNVGFHEALFLPNSDPVSLQTVLSDSRFEIYARPEDTTSWTRHASGKLRSYKKQNEEKELNFKDIRDRCPEELNQDYCYSLFEDIGLNYGPAFQGIETVWRGHKEAIAKIQTPEHLIESLENYTFHPAILDACLHTLFCSLSLDGEDSDMRGDVYLPVSIQQFRFYRRPSAQLWSHTVLLKRDKGISFDGDIRIYNEDGLLVAEALGLHCQNLNISSKAIPDKLNDWLYEYQWHEQQINQEITESNNSDTRNLWLILADERGIGVKLAEFLNNRGCRPVLVYPGKTFERISDTSFRVNAESSEDMKKLFQDSFDLDTCAGLVHLWSLATPACKTLSIDALKTYQISGYGSALYLLHAHAATKWQTPPRIWLVTSGTQSVTGDENLLLAQAPLWGLSRVMGNEHPATRCSIIDLSPDISQDELQLMAQELLTDSPEDEVALRGTRRFVHRFIRLSEKETEEETSGISYELEIQRLGSLDTLRLRQSQHQEPGFGEIEIQVHSVGLNFKDVMKATALLPESVMEKNFWGRALGMECSGTVVKTGKGVQKFQPGDAVIAFAHHSFRSSVITDERLAVLKPEEMSFEKAATIPLAFLTAYYALYYLGGIKQGDRVLIHAATGGVGQAAVQIAQWVGAEIFATAGSPEKREFLRGQSIKYVMDSRSLDFADEIMKITNGVGVDLVLNSLAGEVMEKSFSVLSDYGHFLELGKTDIDRNNRIGLKPFHYNISFSGVDVDRLLAQKPEFAGSLFQNVIQLFENRHLKPLPNQVFPITKVSEAFRFMAGAKHIGKIVVSLDEQKVNIAPAGQIAFNPEATYLITGGLGGFGLVLVHWLVDNGARHLVIVSRSGASSQTAKAAVEALHDKGINVMVAKADVSNEEQVARVFSEMKCMPPLKGVFHAAAILNDGLLKDQNLERYYQVMGSKLLGAWILHNLTLDMPLDYFVLYSSVTSVLGNQGSGNYVAANCFVDSLAYYRRKIGLPALTVNWGVIADVGMAARETFIRHHLERNGLIALYSGYGLKLLGKLLQEKAIQVTVAPINWQQWFKFHETGARPRFSILAQENLESTSEETVSSDTNFFRTVLAEAKPEEHRQIAEKYLRERVARVLGMSPAKLDIHKTFTTLGLDSLMAIEMRSQLEGLGMAVSVSTLLEGTTVVGLIEQVIKVHGFGEEGEKTPAIVKEDDANKNRWVVFPKSNPNAKLRLFCFPYAGGAPTVYYQWPEGLPDSIEVCAINLPGRSRRIKESALTSITETAQAMILYLLPLLDKPFAFFGHCMGSIVMYEVTRILQEEYGKKPVHIFPSASMAPHLYQSPLVHEHPDPKFMEILQLLDFTNTRALVEDKEMRELMFPTLRADFEAVASYSRDFSSRQSLDVPMTAFAAKQDLFAAPNAMLPWQRYTKGSSQFWMLDVHHYFVETHRPFLLKVISHTLSQYIDPASVSPLQVLPSEAEEITSETETEKRKIISATVNNLKIHRDSWLDFLSPNPAAEIRLFCFPPAFGSDPYPRFLAAGLPENIELCSIQLPGRGKRVEEPLLNRISNVVDLVTPILADYLDKPFAFFGHCFGGIIMYEVARKLRREHNVLPDHFFYSGVAAPHMYIMPNAYLLTDDKIIEVLKVISHPLVERLYSDQQFRQEWMPILRADFEMMSKYQPPEEEDPINRPITVIRGRRDLWLYFYGAASWKNYTTESFELFTHLGDHFSLEKDPGFVLDVIKKRIQLAPVAAK